MGRKLKTKVCKACGVEFPIAEFKMAGASGYRVANCEVCYKLYTKKAMNKRKKRNEKYRLPLPYYLKGD